MEDILELAAQCLRNLVPTGIPSGEVETSVRENPEHYRCTCGGNLIRIQQGRGNMENTKEVLTYIADSIRETGNDPCDQLLGYITTGDATYITRYNNARELILKVDKKEVEEFVEILKRAI